MTSACLADVGTLLEGPQLAQAVAAYSNVIHLLKCCSGLIKTTTAGGLLLERARCIYAPCRFPIWHGSHTQRAMPHSRACAGEHD